MNFTVNLALSPVTLVFSTISSLSELDAIEQEWTHLFERIGEPYQFCQSFRWLRTWTKYYVNQHCELSIVVGRHNGRVVVIWPLIKRRKFGLTLLSWMGYPACSYGGVLVEPGSQCAKFLQQSWSYISALHVDIILLPKVPSSASVAPFLRSRIGKPDASGEAPYADFSRTIDFNSRFGGTARANRRRRLRELEKLGNVRFEYCEGGGGSRLGELIHRAIVIKKAWAASRNLFGGFLIDPFFEEFLIDVAKSPGPEGKIFVAALSLDDRVVAVAIRYRCGDMMFALIIAVDDDYRQWHVGQLLQYYALGMAFEAGCTGCDFGRPSTAFKMSFADAVEVVEDWSFAFSNKGWLWQFSRPRLLQLFAHLPVSLQRIVGGRAGNL